MQMPDVQYQIWVRALADVSVSTGDSGASTHTGDKQPSELTAAPWLQPAHGKVV